MIAISVVELDAAGLAVRIQKLFNSLVLFQLQPFLLTLCGSTIEPLCSIQFTLVDQINFETRWDCGYCTISLIRPVLIY